MPIFVCSIEAGAMSRRLVSSGSSVMKVVTDLAINTIGGEFFMEVNICPWTPGHCCFVLFSLVRGEDAALTPSPGLMKVGGNVFRKALWLVNRVL